MTEQAKQILYSPVDVDDADFINVETDPRIEAENAEFEAFKEEMHDSQDDAKITVGKKLTDSRGRPMGKKTMECFECGIDDYTFSQLCTRIREDFGTGLYLIQGRDSNGKYKFKKVVGIQAPNDPNAAKNEGTPASLIASMSRAMADQQDRFERLMLNAPQVQNDPIKQMTEMMTAMGGMMGALGLGGQNQQAPKSILETLTELKLTKDIIGDLVGNPSEGGNVDNFWGAIAEAAKSFGGPLMQAVTLAQQQGTVDADGVIKPPALPAPEPELEPVPDGTIEPEKVPDGTKESEQNAMNLEQMKEQLSFLLIQAENGVKHEIVVDFIIEQMPDEDNAYDQLENFLQQEHCIDRCAMIKPEINQYREWFIGWRELMLTKLAAMIEPDANLTSDSETPDDAELLDAGDADGIDATKPEIGDSIDSDGDTGGSGGDIRDP